MQLEQEENMAIIRFRTLIYRWEMKSQREWVICLNAHYELMAKFRLELWPPGAKALRLLWKP